MSSLDPASVARRLKRIYSRRTLDTLLPDPAGINPDDPPLPELESYRNDPVGFCRDVLGTSLTEDQETILRAIPVFGRVKVNSAHNIGKTFLAACAVLWWFHTRPKSVVITTAPTERDVLDLLWTEIRLLHGRAKRPLPDYFCGPRAAEMYDNGDHWAKGYTARDAVSFQGRHRESMLYVFDEAEGIPPFFWDVTGTSYKPGHDHAWLAIGNPVTTSSQSYLEDRAKAPDGSPKWRLFTLSALNHPNVLAELAGLPPPIPNAVSLTQVNQWVKDWCEPVEVQDKRPNDLEWPPNSGKWYRPGPQMLARGMGIRPVDGVDTAIGAKAWAEATYKRHSPAYCWLHYFGITIGVDVATYGDDSTAIHVRSGPLSVHHETHNGWMPSRTAERIKELCVEWSAWYNAQA